MKKIFSLYGRSHVVKSTTVKLTESFLTALYPNASRQVLHNNGDICFLLKIKTVLIGVESQGDPNSRLGNSLQHFVQQKCDFILCTSRTSGSTCHLIDALTQYGYSLEYIRQTYDLNLSTQQSTNYNQAISILEKIVGSIEVLDAQKRQII